MVTGALPPYHAGAGVQAFYLSKSLSEKHYIKIDIITQRLGRDRIVEGLNLKIKIFRIPVITKRLIIRKIMFSIGICLKILMSKKYDIVHFHDYGLLYLLPAFISKKIRKSSVIAKAATLGVELNNRYNNNKILKYAFLYSLKMPDKYICQTDEMYNNFRKIINKKKLILQLNGVDIDKFNPKKIIELKLIKEKYSLPENKKIITFIGAVEPLKNVKKLIEAIGILRARHENDMLLLVVGPYSENLGNNNVDRKYYNLLNNYYIEIKKIITRECLDNFIKFIGPCSFVEEILAITDIFVMPSEIEGTCNVVLEAMASIKPVILSRIPAFDHFKDRYHCLKFDNRSELDLADKIEMILSDFELRINLANNGHNYIVQNYSIGKVANNYYQIYKNLLTNHD